ncbi:hypothetical protein GE09DRAFT_57531 [Coniochaeta sp. 2T2.1]|nr:hypothetical protein GE09DRAFT_57531 [Coniochaeta sp. 2T2.1]
MSSPPSMIGSSFNPDEEADIVFSDPNEPFVVKPIIEDLLRTRYCIPGSVFLVEAIDRLSPIRRRYRAIRLLVSDGISCVQTVLKGETHGLVDSGQIYEGCYVRVDKFALRFIDISDGGGADLKGKGKERQTERRKMVYLLLDNPVTVGWNNAYMKILESEKQAPSPEPAVVDKEPEPDANRGGRLIADEKDQPPPVVAAADKETLDRTASNREESPDHGGTIVELDLSALDSIALPKSEAAQPDSNLVKPVEPSSHVPRPSSNAPQPSSYHHLPWSTDDPTKPVKLTSLHLIPHLPYKQNWMVNVLAVVASLSEVEPSHLPPYHQRTARLADPSTSKQVLLTVFLDPDDFNPAVGSVVLILGAKNHRFDGGSLKKYASDRPKNGGRWWFEEPRELGWCDVAGLTAWWEEKQKNT